MKNLLFFSILVLLASCSKKEEMENVEFEITTLDSFTHEHATEFLRLNILSEYGGTFRQMELYHKQVFDIGMPCDSVFTIDFIEENLPKYSLSLPIKVHSYCDDSQWNTGANRHYTGYQKEGTLTVESEMFGLEILLNDSHTLYSYTEEERHSYGQDGIRKILVSKGMAPELSPTIRLKLNFWPCNYDTENVAITEASEVEFKLYILTVVDAPVY